MCPEASSPAPTSYSNATSSIDFLRALALRLSTLRKAADDLEALAAAGERILRDGAAKQRSSLSPYWVRASVVVTVCAAVEGMLMDLAVSAKETEQLPLSPKNLRGSALDQVKLFFTKVAGLRFPSQTPEWRELKALFELRHAIVHAWGRVREQKRDAVGVLNGVKFANSGEAWLEAEALEAAIGIMRRFADQLEGHLGGSQDTDDEVGT